MGLIKTNFEKAVVRSPNNEFEPDSYKGVDISHFDGVFIANGSALSKAYNNKIPPYVARSSLSCIQSDPHFATFLLW